MIRIFEITEIKNAFFLNFTVVGLGYL